MRDAFVCGEEVVLEGFGGVGACELVRFGGWVEELDGGGGVDWEVVDGFEGLATFGGFELWEHGD